MRFNIRPELQLDLKQTYGKQTDEAKVSAYAELSETAQEMLSALIEAERLNYKFEESDTHIAARKNALLKMVRGTSEVHQRLRRSLLSAPSGRRVAIEYMSPFGA